MMDWPCLVVAIIVGIIAGVALFGGMTWACMELVIAHFQSMAPNDPSAGDSAGWALVVLAPFVLPIFALLSLLVSIVVGMVVYRKLPGKGDQAAN
jgi:hypothetical protein